MYKTATIADVMTRGTHTIGHDRPVTEAEARMREYGVRHLPVLDGGVIVGIVSERDVAMVEALRGVDPKTTPIEEAMASAPYCVGPKTALTEVLTHMIEHKYGSAVVTEHDRVLGIFTTIDALRLLRSTLQ